MQRRELRQKALVKLRLWPQSRWAVGPCPCPLELTQLAMG